MKQNVFVCSSTVSSILDNTTLVTVTLLVILKVPLVVIKSPVAREPNNKK